MSVLTGVLHRDGALLSASEVLRAELSAADHLGVLGSIWYDQARHAQATRFAALLRDLLPETDADAALADPACAWLWRSLREAEAAGRDAADVLHSAIAARSLHDARDIARVLDSRIRRTLAGAVPQPRAAWSERVPETGDPELNRFMAELAAAMDDRTHRIGEHAARTAPRWATRALGAVPADPVLRLAWEQRAAKLGAYRELYGYDAPGDPIGPEPGKTSPEARADWHTAFEALGKIDGIDMRRYTDGQLRLQRATYEQETSWAPPYVAEELRLARLQARTAFEHSTRERFEARAARAARDREPAARHERLAAQWRALHARAATLAGALASAQETRRQWAALTEPTRRVAVAADTELRRRYPDRYLPPLRSAEPGPSGMGVPASATETAGAQAVLAGGEREAGGQVGVALAMEPPGRDLTGQIARIMASARAA